MQLLFIALIGMLAGVLGILGGYVVYKVVGWYIEGTMSLLHCVLVAGFYVGAIFSLMAHSYILAVLQVAVVANILFFPKFHDRRMLRAMYDEDIYQYRRSIAADSRNLAARERLAETLYKKGLLDESIAEYGDLLSCSPQDRKVAYRLKQLMELRNERKNPSITCPSCGFTNSPGRTRCYHCEGDLSVLSEMKKWLANGGMKQLATTWAIGTAASTIILFTLTLLPLPIRIALCALFLVIIISAQLLYVWLHY
jgi:hypothetical protein